MNSCDFTRCDNEFETIEEDLDMSTTSIVKGVSDYVMPDISRELALLGFDKNFNEIKEGKHMLPIGTKVVVRGCKEYMGKLTGRVGTVCKHYAIANKIGVSFEDIKNPESKDGVFWFDEKSLLMYKEAGAMMRENDIKSVIFNGNKTIILWDDGTKTIATCGENDTFDPYAGFCAAVTKRVFGSTGKAKRLLKSVMKGLPKLPASAREEN